MQLPVLSIFYGIIVRMYREQGGKHNMPHIHAEYSGEEIVVALDGTVLEGSFPKNKLKLLEAWIVIHHEDLEANWKLLSNGEQPKLTKVEPVKPLKLCLYYETGEVKLFDAAPYATGSWYGRLQDERYFATVHLLPGGIGIECE